ncbi:MAG: response regulator [Sandaracinaceae bacterium]|nr:response regulator [Sandaracinaceae bacterium]
MTRRDTRRPSVDEARPRVLFVDDERHVQRAFEQAAFSLGVVVELANSATQALRAVERGRFDVIAVDLSMPGLDGLGMVERLREVSPSSAFVLVSGAPSLELPTRPDVHLDAFVVVKPWDPQVLRDTLLDALERAEEPRPASLDRAARVRRGQLAGAGRGRCARGEHARVAAGRGPVRGRVPRHPQPE